MDSGSGPGSGRLPPVRKSLGQHFLNDRRILSRIVDALDPAPSDVVIEIGPGRGALTELLVARAGHVFAIEYDRALVQMLRERYESSDRITIVESDVLELKLGEVAGPSYLLVGNVPYYITTPIIFQGLTRPRPRRAVFLVQREVAERIAAPPGDRAYGALSVNVQAFAAPELVFRIPAGAFHPPPKVESAVLRLTPLAHEIVGPEQEENFRAFVQAAFGLRRKQMRRVLRELWSIDAAHAEEVLAAVGVEPSARPETLSPADFARLIERRPANRDS
jgi:16S rRNA (adenine1518-N6/adenine1519-N6)-dimethyltransferase